MEDPVKAWIDGKVVEATSADIKVGSTSGKTVSVVSSSLKFVNIP